MLRCLDAARHPSLVSPPDVLLALGNMRSNQTSAASKPYATTSNAEQNQRVTPFAATVSGTQNIQPKRAELTSNVIK